MLHPYDKAKFTLNKKHVCLTDLDNDMVKRRKTVVTLKQLKQKKMISNNNK